MKIGALVIGQTPRPDLTDALVQAIGDSELIVRGALDGLTLSDLPDASEAAFPLVTRMRSGELVYLPEEWVEGRLQTQLLSLEADGVVATILLCAGTFAAVRGNKPIVKPYDFGRTLLNTLNLNRIGVVAPFPAQEKALRDRWTTAGFAVTTWTADIPNVDADTIAEMQHQIDANKLQAILLDYVGYSAETVRSIQEETSIPVIDCGALAIAAIGAL